MEINVIASTKLGYVAPKENLDKFAGLTAGICYLPATTDKLFSENEEKTFKRVNMIKESGHLSPFDHANITLELIDVPKIIAMILNDAQFYTASEKSARYKKMNCEGDEKEGYDKWSEEKAPLYPLGRIGDAKKDVAPTIEFLLSDKSLWTTGAVYLVDGGKSI